LLKISTLKENLIEKMKREKVPKEKIIVKIEDSSSDSNKEDKVIEAYEFKSFNDKKSISEQNIYE
jgi:hypothetical protein